MKLALGQGYSGAVLSGDVDRVLEAERLGYDSVWTAESYGSDAVTTIAWIAARTTRIHVGTAIMQIGARTPAASAMIAMTLDALSGGRFRLGLGVSNPQVIEGWHGQRFGKLLARIAMFREWLAEGFRRAGAPKPPFDVMAACPVVVGDDVDACRAQHRPAIALYVGGMGAPSRNFYNETVRHYGYEEAARTIQDLYLAGRKREAEAAVPDALVDEIGLFGPRERIRERLAAYREAGVTTLAVRGNLDAVRLMAELVL